MPPEDHASIRTVSLLVWPTRLTGGEIDVAAASCRRRSSA